MSDKQFLRKRQVATRYGGITLRSIERAVAEGRIPPPEFPCGPNTPLWDRDKLEAAERAAVAWGSKPRWRDRLRSELAAAPRDQAPEILHRHQFLINALPVDAREKLLAELQDVIAETPSTD